MIEGFVGGGLLVMLCGVLLYCVMLFSFGVVFGILFVIVIVGFVGGFVLLVVKCLFGMKDWGLMIVGYGGMFDCVDLICFVVLVFFYFVCYLYV